MTTVTHIEQFCPKCKKWYALGMKIVKSLEQHWLAGTKVALTVTCTHCHATNVALPIGLYDKTDKPRHKCAVQWVLTKG